MRLKKDSRPSPLPCEFPQRDVNLYRNRELWINNGLVQFSVRKKTGYVNTNGKVKIDPRFESGGPFSDGAAAVVFDGKFGYIKPDGREGFFDPKELNFVAD